MHEKEITIVVNLLREKNRELPQSISSGKKIKIKCSVYWPVENFENIVNSSQKISINLTIIHEKNSKFRTSITEQKSPEIVRS